MDFEEMRLMRIIINHQICLDKLDNSYIHREETRKSILKQIKSESKLSLKRNRNAEVIFQTDL